MTRDQSVSLLVSWLTEHAVQRDHVRFLKLLSARFPDHWDDVVLNKTWLLLTDTLRNVRRLKDRREPFEDPLLLRSLTRLVENVFLKNPRFFSDDEQKRLRAYRFLWSLRCLSNVSERREKLKKESASQNCSSAIIYDDEKARPFRDSLLEETSVFWNDVIRDSQDRFRAFAKRVLSEETLGIAEDITAVIQNEILPKETALEAFFSRGWEDYLNSDDPIFAYLVDLKKNLKRTLLTESILTDIMYNIYGHERRATKYPSRIPLMNPGDDELTFIRTV